MQASTSAGCRAKTVPLLPAPSSVSSCFCVNPHCRSSATKSATASHVTYGPPRCPSMCRAIADSAKPSCSSRRICCRCCSSLVCGRLQSNRLCANSRSAAAACSRVGASKVLLAKGRKLNLLPNLLQAAAVAFCDAHVHAADEGVVLTRLQHGDV